MLFAVPNLFGIALKLLNLEAVPILPLDAEKISLGPPPLLDIGRLEGGRDDSIRFNKIHKTFHFVCLFIVYMEILIFSFEVSISNVYECIICLHTYKQVKT